ncbi:MAG: hypothetical protein GY861_24535 [bacterium]|nr:hypothetical protein [bacterium]
MKELSRRSDSDLYGDSSIGGFHFSESILSGITSDPVHIRPTGRSNTIGTAAVICGTGTARIEYTIDTVEVIKEGGATWFIWDKGSVTGNALDVFTSAITALRCVSISGSITWKILM